MAPTPSSLYSPHTTQSSPATAGSRWPSTANAVNSNAVPHSEELRIAAAVCIVVLARVSSAASRATARCGGRMPDAVEAIELNILCSGRASMLHSGGCVCVSRARFRCAKINVQRALRFDTVAVANIRQLRENARTRKVRKYVLKWCTAQLCHIADRVN